MRNDMLFRNRIANMIFLPLLHLRALPCVLGLIPVTWLVQSLNMSRSTFTFCGYVLLVYSEVKMTAQDFTVCYSIIWRCCSWFGLWMLNLLYLQHLVLSYYQLSGHSNLSFGTGKCRGFGEARSNDLCWFGTFHAPFIASKALTLLKWTETWKGRATDGNKWEEHWLLVRVAKGDMIAISQRRKNRLEITMSDLMK